MLTANACAYVYVTCWGTLTGKKLLFKVICISLSYYYFLSLLFNHFISL